MPDIRIMTVSDIDFAVSMTDREGWGNVAADFLRLISLEPEGCFVAWDNDEPVGMISTTTYGGYAFMGSLIVRPDRRRRGAGEALMRQAIAYLRTKKIVCIELDATPEGAPLYRRLGFKDKYSSLRFYRRGDSHPRAETKSSVDRSLDEITQLVTEIDRQSTGLDRSRVLTRLIREFPESVFLEPSSSPEGFAIVFPRSTDRMNIGPLVAANAAIAESIIDSIIRAYPSRDLGLGVPASQSDIKEILTQRGFYVRPPSLRMYHGEHRRYETHVYAIVSPEKG